MKHRILHISALVGLCFLLGSCHADVKVADYGNISDGQKVTYQDGDPFRARRKVNIIYPAENKKVFREAEFLSEYLKRKLKLRGNLQTDTAKRGIVLSIDTTITQTNGYRINIDSKQIRISGRTEEGLWQGIRALRQTMPAIKHRRVVFFPAADICSMDM